MKKIILTLIIIAGINLTNSYSQVQPMLPLGSNGDILNETPIHKIPQDMTFEEYRDANRRISSALLLASIPVPGMIHFYAGESKKGWILVGTAGVGLASIIGGAATGKEKEQKSKFKVVEIEGKKYEQIPIEIEGTTTKYALREVRKEKEPSGLGTALILTGVVLIAGEVIYDWVDGIRTIEKKRDQVRFKYGKTITWGLQPNINPFDKSAGVTLGLNF
jgi:hypothetical protein